MQDDNIDNLEKAIKIVLDQNKLEWKDAAKICILITNSSCKRNKKILANDILNSNIK